MTPIQRRLARLIEKITRQPVNDIPTLDCEDEPPQCQRRAIDLAADQYISQLVASGCLESPVFLTQEVYQ